MKKKLSTTKKVLIGICLVLALIIVSTLFVINHYSSKVERVEIDRSVVTETGKEPAKEDQDLITTVKMKNTEIFMVLQTVL